MLGATVTALKRNLAMTKRGPPVLKADGDNLIEREARKMRL